MAKQTAADKLAEFNSRVADLAERSKLPKINSLTEDVNIPPALSAITAALLTGRGELAKAMAPVPLTPDESKALFTLVGELLDTNQALQEHARETAQLVNTWASHFTGLTALGRKIEHFANFRPIGTDEEEDVGPQRSEPDDGPYLIWSNEHGAWWAPDKIGYVALPHEAGRYTRAQVLEIVKNASYGSPHNGTLNELPIREADLREAFRDVVPLANNRV